MSLHWNEFTLQATEALARRLPSGPPQGHGALLNSLNAHNPTTNGSNGSVMVLENNQVETTSYNDEPRFNTTLTTNEGERELGYYDPTTLSPDSPKPLFVYFTFHDDIPTVDGIPFWERLPSEPTEYYEAFKKYRDTPITTFDQLSSQLDADPRVLSCLARIWLWHERKRHFAKYAELKREADRITNIEVMNKNHRDAAQKLLETATQAIDTIDTDTLTSTQIVELIKAGSSLERLSNNLPANQPNPDDSNNSNNGNGQKLQINGDKVQVIFDPNWKSV